MLCSKSCISHLTLKINIHCSPLLTGKEGSSAMHVTDVPYISDAVTSAHFSKGMCSH